MTDGELNIQRPLIALTKTKELTALLVLYIEPKLSDDNRGAMTL